MNKKGQVLVIFILLIPVFLMLLGFIIDIGSLYIENKHVDSSLRDATEYALKHISEIDAKEKTEQLLNKNIKNISNKLIIIDGEEINITLEKNYQGMFKILFNNNIYKINKKYFGYINDGKFIINKE